MIWQFENIIKIAGNLNGRVQKSLNLPAGDIRDFIGQKIPLNLSPFFSLQRSRKNFVYI
jgi:hypothetical protein